MALNFPLWIIHPNILLKLLQKLKSKRANAKKKYLCGERSYFIHRMKPRKWEILVMPNDHYSVT
jgi:hypothetical protein